MMLVKNTFKINIATSLNINVLTISILLLNFSCAKKVEENFSSTKSTNSLRLYVSTGSCNSGTGLTTYTTTSTRTIESYELENGVHEGTLLDYNGAGNFAAATHPKSIIDNGSELYVLNENSTSTSERKIILVPKSKPNAFSNYYMNPSVFNGALVSLSKDTEGSLFISKSTAVEKINSTPIRIPAGASPWVNAPTGSCATATTFISNVLTLPPVTSGTTGRMVFSHQGSTAALNRLGVISNTGYFTAADCLSGVQISSITHTKAANLAPGPVAFHSNGTSPTSMVLIPFTSGTITSRLLVSYSNGQTSNNNSGTYNLNHGLVLWDVVETNSTATLTNPVVIYDNTSYLFGVSAMTYKNGYLYVATAGESGAVNQTLNGYGYNIEKFSLLIDSDGSPLLTRVPFNNQPYIKGGAYTKCINALAIGH